MYLEHLKILTPVYCGRMVNRQIFFAFNLSSKCLYINRHVLAARVIDLQLLDLLLIDNYKRFWVHLAKFNAMAKRPRVIVQQKIM